MLTLLFYVIGLHVFLYDIEFRNDLDSDMYNMTLNLPLLSKSMLPLNFSPGKKHIVMVTFRVRLAFW